MIKPLLVILILIVNGSCQSSPDIYEKYPDRVEVTSPKANMIIAEKELYLHSAELQSSSDKHFLVIKGDFPNACTQIQKTKKLVDANTLSLQLKGWQNQNDLCTQVITPFTFLYPLDLVDMNEIDTIRINNTQLILD